MLRALWGPGGPLSNLSLKTCTRDGATLATAAKGVLDETLKDLGIKPRVRTRYAAAEELSRRFAPKFFDLVHVTNALDHTQDPVVALREATAVGQSVLIATWINESKLEHGIGMHRWNLFADRRGHFFVEDGRRNKQRTAAVDVNQALGSSMKLKTRFRPALPELTARDCDNEVRMARAKRSTAADIARLRGRCMLEVLITPASFST